MPARRNAAANMISGCKGDGNGPWTARLATRRMAMRCRWCAATLCRAADAAAAISQAHCPHSDPAPRLTQDEPASDLSSPTQFPR